MESGWEDIRENIPVKNHYFVKTNDPIALTRLIDTLTEAAQTAHLDVYELEKQSRPHLAFMITRGTPRYEIEELYAAWSSTGED